MFQLILLFFIKRGQLHELCTMRLHNTLDELTLQLFENWLGEVNASAEQIGADPFAGRLQDYGVLVLL